MTNKINIVFDAPNEPEPHPCIKYGHRWAYLASGGQECSVCGVRR